MMKTLSVIGLGYIGLPTAALFAANGYTVFGVDNNEAIVRTINSGHVHIDEVGLRTLVSAAVKSGKLSASVEARAADAFIIAVPTPIMEDKRPDLSYVYSAMEKILPVLKAGDLLIVESTVPPGTADELARRLEVSRPDLVGSDGVVSVLIAHCPERVLPGQILKELVDNDRVVGGRTPEATAAATHLYAGIVSGEILPTDATTAEMVKLAENTYRDVNIALANEIAVICEKLNISVWDVIKFASRHPRVKYLSPGPGVGGHCIAVDPWFIVAQFPGETGLVKAARLRNDSMPAHVARVAMELIADIPTPKVACLGASYKGNVGDPRESPALEVVRLLREQLPENAVVAVNDMHISGSSLGLEPLVETLEGADIIILLADHKEYRLLDPVEVGKSVRTKRLFDTRNHLVAERWRAAGFKVRTLGQRRESDELGD
jgi:UDP-N-acetyl-D-mannosaminuronic acid dehydrogenase